MNKFFALIVFIGISGCSSIEKAEHRGSKSTNEDEVIVSFAGTNLEKSELRRLKSAAKGGDSESAFRLYNYYSIGRGANEKLANKYFDIALRLEHPIALYNRAFEIWVYQREPDVMEVYGLLKKAIEKGHRDERGLLDEIEQAKATGVVPLESKFRLFLN